MTPPTLTNMDEQDGYDQEVLDIESTGLTVVEVIPDYYELTDPWLGSDYPR